MKFRNITSDDRALPALNATVKAGELLSVDAEEAAGLVGQAVGEHAWLEPADEDAEKAVADYEGATEAAQSTEPPPKSASHAAWIGYAEAQGDEHAATKTKKQLIAEHGASEESA